MWLEVFVLRVSSSSNPIQFSMTLSCALRCSGVACMTSSKSASSRGPRREVLVEDPCHSARSRSTNYNKHLENNDIYEITISSENAYDVLMR